MVKRNIETNTRCKKDDRMGVLKVKIKRIAKKINNDECCLQLSTSLQITPNVALPPLEQVVHLVAL